MSAQPHTTIVLCRDCKHWLCHRREQLADYSRDRNPKDGWLDGVCPVLKQRLNITDSGGWDGATVDSVETDANFWCAFGEIPTDGGQP